MKEELAILLALNNNNGNNSRKRCTLLASDGDCGQSIVPDTGRYQLQTLSLTIRQIGVHKDGLYRDKVKDKLNKT